MVSLDENIILPFSAMVAGSYLLISYFGPSDWTLKKQKKRPPFSRATLWQAIQGLIGTSLHTFLIDQLRATGSSLYRLSITGVVVIANSDDARKICQDPSTIKPSFLYGVMESFSSGPNLGTIADNGHNWHHRRKGINPAFAPKFIRQMNEVARLKVHEWTENKLLPWVEKGQAFDVAAEMIAITISVICKAAFLYDISEKEATSLHKTMRDCFEEFSYKASFNPLRKFATWILQDRRNAFHQANVLKEFAYKLLDLYKRNHAQTATSTDPTVIGLIVANENYKDDTERISDIIILLFAGHDTTGYSAAFALMELAKCPEEQKKLRRELAQPANADGCNRRSYLNCVISETMRLHSPAVVAGFKELRRDFVSKDGYYLPKGTIALIAHVAFGQDPLLFPDPSSFQPSRWLDISGEAKAAQFPFSLGKRNCVGQPLALAELNTFLSYLIQKFEFVVVEEGTTETRGILRLNGCLLKAIKVSPNGPPILHPETTNEDLLKATTNTMEFEENNSLYWHNSIYKVDEVTGTFSLPDISFSTAYYRWDNTMTDLVPFPDDFKMITGIPPNDGIHTQIFSECCSIDDEDCFSPADGLFPTETCGFFGTAIRFPICWNGKSDSDDHTSHVAYTDDGTLTGRCPDSHSMGRLPQLQLFIRINNYEGGVHMFADGGDILHADFMNGWEPGTFDMLFDQCEGLDGDDGVTDIAGEFDDDNPPCACSDLLTLAADIPCPVDATAITEEDVFSFETLPRGTCSEPLLPKSPLDSSAICGVPAVFPEVPGSSNVEDDEEDADDAEEEDEGGEEDEGDEGDEEDEEDDEVDEDEEDEDEEDEDGEVEDEDDEDGENSPLGLIALVLQWCI